MPIEGISEVRRLPRLGVIRLGEKRTNAGGKQYPAKLDYFNCKDAGDVTAVFGEKPRAIEIMLPHEDPNVFFPQDRKAYGVSTGLWCKGDGRTANRTRLGISDGAVKDGKPARVPKGQAFDPEGERFIKEQGLQVAVGKRFELPCLGEGCAYTMKKMCRPLGQLLFLIPKVPRFGCYQISTTSFNSMVELNSYFEAVRNVAGRLSMIPLTLSLVPKKVQADGKATTIYHLKVEYKGSLPELARYRDAKYIAADLLPQIEHETPADHYPEGGEELDRELGGKAQPAQPADGPSEPGPSEPVEGELVDSEVPPYHQSDPSGGHVGHAAPPLPAKPAPAPTQPKKSPLAPPKAPLNRRLL